jgi:hypothetical protein
MFRSTRLVDAEFATGNQDALLATLTELLCKIQPM